MKKDILTQGLHLLEKPKCSVMSMNDLSEADLIEYQKWIVEKELETYKQLKKMKLKNKIGGNHETYIK